MIKRTHNKLVRDNIPDMLQERGVNSCITVCQPDQVMAALRTKMVEEAVEVGKAKGADVVVEMADLMEVFICYATLNDLDMHTIINMMERKREKCGSYAKMVYLHWTEELDGRETGSGGNSQGT